VYFYNSCCVTSFIILPPSSNPYRTSIYKAHCRPHRATPEEVGQDHVRTLFCPKESGNPNVVHSQNTQGTLPIWSQTVFSKINKHIDQRLILQDNHAKFHTQCNTVYIYPHIGAIGFETFSKYKIVTRLSTDAMARTNLSKMPFLMVLLFHQIMCASLYTCPTSRSTHICFA
jgi:hypothetical protein